LRHGSHAGAGDGARQAGRRFVGARGGLAAQGGAAGSRLSTRLRGFRHSRRVRGGIRTRLPRRLSQSFPHRDPGRRRHRQHTMTCPRIALVTRRYWPQVGGAERAMAGLAAEFRQQGHPCMVLTAQWEPHWPTECVHREVPVTRLAQPQVRGWGTIRYMHALSRWFRRHAGEWDAVLVSMLKHDAYAAITSLRRTRVPVVLRAEGAGDTGDVQWQRTARFGSRIKQACLEADALIAPSAAIADELMHAGYLPSRIHLIPNGVPLRPPASVDAKRSARQAIAGA